MFVSLSLSLFLSPFFFFNDTATTEIYTLSLHDALPIYDYIDSMRNVELVPLSHTSFDLIDKCKASATVSGTVGWESILRGKPAFLFGYSWYRDCEGVFTVRTAEDAEKALRHIEDGYVVDKKKVMLYVSAVEEVSMKGYIDDIYEAMNTLTPEENVRNLAVSINDFYHKRA